MDIDQLDLFQISQKLNSREMSSVELVEHCLATIESKNPKLNAVLAVNQDAIQQARACDELRAQSSSEPSILLGVPIGIKDMFCTKGVVTTAASRILQSFRPPYDATAVSRLKGNGAVVVAKLNQDEFAMGSTSESSYFGPVVHPTHSDRVPGGSSGGSAAAVASGMVPVALGTDTGGSVRQPASFCGLFGLKPTYGRVSRFGMISYGSSLDQAGPIARTARDCGILLQAMSGRDSFDSTASNMPPFEYQDLKRESLSGVRVGLLNAEEIESSARAGKIHSDVIRLWEKTRNALEALGAEVVNVSFSTAEYAVPTYYLIATAEASSNLSRYDGVRYGFRAEAVGGRQRLDEMYRSTRSLGFGFEVKKRILLGTFSLSAGYYDQYFRKACQVRRMIQSELLDLLTRVDFLMCPVATSPAPLLGQTATDPVESYWNDAFTVPANLSGLPALSVPVGRSTVDNLPIGMQLIGRKFEENTILNAGDILARHLKTSGDSASEVTK